MTNYPKDINDILSKLHNIKQLHDNEWQSDCPCDGHKTPQKHLSISNNSNKALVTCFGGTHTYEDICKSLGFDGLTYSIERTNNTQNKSISKIYQYKMDKKVIFETVRYEPKDFRQRRPDNNGGYIWSLQGIELCLYHYDEVQQSILNNDTIYIPEGEKDADTLWDWGFTGTTNPLGADAKKPESKWLDRYTQSLRNANVVILADNDSDKEINVGLLFANYKVNCLKNVCKSVKLIKFDVKDVSDWFSQGHTDIELRELVAKAPELKDKIRVTKLGGSNLMSMHFDPIKWIVPNMLPQGMALLAGTPKTGKSRMALNIALAVATGGKALGKMNVKQGSVLFLSLEDSARRMHEHLTEIYYNTEVNLDKIEFWFETKLINEGGLQDIEQWLKDHPDARLVVVDTLQKIRPKETNGGLYAQDYNAVSPLTDLSSKYNIAIVVIHHLNKRQNSEDPMELISGTTGLTGGVDSTIVVKRKRGENQAVMHLYGRDMEDTDIALDFTGGSWVWLGNEKQVRMSEDRQAIIDFLKTTPDQKPNDIAKTLGKNQSTIRNLLVKMVKDEQVSYFEGVYNAITQN